MAGAVADLFREPAGHDSDGPGLVGVEREWIPARPGKRPGTVGVAVLTSLLARDPSLMEAAHTTFEPGGQLEISPPASRSVRLLLEQLATYTARLAGLTAQGGVELFSSGLNPWHTLDELGLQTPGPRYVRMQEQFDRIGPSGRRMMRQTAALQMSFDLGPAEVALKRWRVANLAGPALAAAFANSPILEGEPRGLPGTRSAIWQEVDDSRTGFAGGQVAPSTEPDSVATAYLQFVLGASIMPLPREGEAPSSSVRSFGAWLAEGGDRPDREDLEHHLTTLFPPVRPRHHLEIRYIDALPDRWQPVPVTVLAALFYDRAATDEALGFLSEESIQAAAWQTSASAGMRDPGLAATALGLFEIALAAIPRLPAGYLDGGGIGLVSEYRDRFLASGRCPADEQLESYQRDPEDLATWR